MIDARAHAPKRDLARSGFGGSGIQRAWLAAPPGMPSVASLIKDRQAGVLVWKQTATASGGTDLHLPQSFTPERGRSGSR
jgi:hypothetical protein